MRWQAGYAVIIVDWYYRCVTLYSFQKHAHWWTYSSRPWLCQLAGNLLHVACR